MSVLQKIFRSAERHEAARRAAQVDPLIARIVHATDKRLAYVKGYRERLRGPLSAARSALEHAIAGIPGPMEVGAAAWSHDKTVRALFAGAGDPPAAFSASPGIRAFFEANPAAPDCFAMLALAPVHRRVIANALQGDRVQADVARTTVSFTQPQVLAPCVDEAGVRAELVARALEYLALLALQRVVAMRAERHTLEQERALLAAELQLARRRGAGLAALVAADAGPPARDAAAVERDLERKIDELQQAASRELLPCLLDEMAEALQRHGERIGFEPCELTLDAMNFEVAPSPQAVTPAVAMLRLARRGVFAVLVARFPRSELRAPASLAGAERYL